LALEEALLVDKEEIEPALSSLDKKLIRGGTTNRIDWLQAVVSKHGDTDMDTSLWEVRALSCLNIINEDHYVRGVKALNVMRIFIHCRWYQRIWNEIRSYLLEKYREDCFKTGCQRHSNKV
jgi:hypothetical protein